MRSIIESATAQIRAASERFPWGERRAYGDWLAQTYYYVRHSTRLLAAASSRFPQDDRGDALHHRFAVHIAEEKRHEVLAQRDLERLGLSLDAFPERSATRMFYEPQYYKIEHQAPSVLFGYILPLEAIGPAQGPQVSSTVTAAFGPKCATFIDLHAREDDDHIEKALSLLQSVPLTESVLVLRNLEQTTYAYCALLRDIAENPVALAGAQTT